MKYVIVQVSKYYVCITPAESGKAFISSGKDRDSKKPDYEVTFREPLVVFLPESLRGQAWNFPRDLAEVVKMAMRNAKIDIKDVILCAECDQLISQEYQHTPAKDKYLKIFAENEAKGLVGDDISNYTLILLVALSIDSLPGVIYKTLCNLCPCCLKLIILLCKNECRTG